MCSYGDLLTIRKHYRLDIWHDTSKNLKTSHEPEIKHRNIARKIGTPQSEIKPRVSGFPVQYAYNYPTAVVAFAN
jgi:hypothetical protein